MTTPFEIKVKPIIPPDTSGRYPFPDNHKWVSGETGSFVDLKVEREARIKNLMATLFYSGTAQMFTAYVNGLYASTIITSPLVIATDVQTQTLESSVKITGKDTETETLEVNVNATILKADIGNLHYEEDTISNFHWSSKPLEATKGSIKLKPYRATGQFDQDGHLEFGEITLTKDSFTSSTDGLTLKAKSANIITDKLNVQNTDSSSGISIFNHTISSFKESEDLNLESQRDLYFKTKSGRILTIQSDLHVGDGKSLYLENAQNNASVDLKYSESFVNFTKYTWPAPESLLIPIIPSISVSYDYLTYEDDGKTLKWDSFLAEQIICEPESEEIGPLLTYKTLTPSSLEWSTIEIEGAPPESTVVRITDPFLTKDSSGNLSWIKATVSVTCPVPVLGESHCLKCISKEKGVSQ